MLNSNKALRSSCSEQDSSKLSPTSLRSGTLLSLSGQYVPLRHYHILGRSAECHTSVTGADISRIHSLIYWQDNNWYIEDKSKNGVWHNGNRMIKDQPYLLQKSDTIALSSRVSEAFTLVSDLKPCDVLISLDLTKANIYLEENIVPIEETLTFFYENEGWYAVYNGDGEAGTFVQDGDVVRINGTPYRLQSSQPEPQTLENETTTRSLNDIELRLDISDNEKEIQLYVKDAKSSAVIEGDDIQSQSDLLLCLARKSIADKKLGHPECHCGWINIENLSIALSTTPNDTRIHLHRLRTRIRDTVSASGIDAPQLIQLQGGEVRLNASKVLVMKENQPEIEFDHYLC